MAIQTPKQRIANQKFNKRNEKFRKYGKKKETPQQWQLPVSRGWLILLGFLIVGGGVLELLSQFFA
ncbi:uncharacterized protein ZBIST_2796 [Zygosaccharomyces bailii]|nr:uncharacterized protein ZBIST_2796 [Zygosaccharomyces bailii]